MFFHVLILKCTICIFCPLFFTLPNGVYRTRPYALFVFKMLWGLFIRMRLTYDDSFISLLKAAILSDVWNAELIHESLSKNCPSVNTYSLKRCLLEWEWVHEPAKDISKLKNAVSLFLLHKYKDYNLLFKVLQQALLHGPEYILMRKSPEASKFCNMVRSVRSEYHRARIFSTFKQVNNKLFCNYYFNHKIQPLLANYLSKRFPDKEVIVNNYFKQPSQELCLNAFL